MLPFNALREMNVMFATPCYISSVSMNYAIGIFNLATTAKGIGLNCSHCMLSDSLVTRARNLIVKAFLANDQYTHLFWIDSDISFEPSNVIRLLVADRDVVAGAYPKKGLFWPENGLPEDTTKEQFENRHTKFSFNLIDNAKPIAHFIDTEQFIEVAEAPTGFMCIKRHVFTEMMEKYPDLHFKSDDLDDQQDHFNWRFFDCMVEPDTGRYLSEDYAFCHRWCSIGGKVYIDLACDLGHLGQYLFKGNLAQCLSYQKDKFFIEAGM